ncbi:DoxX family protein [Kitasatospora sp. GP82]|uniref:DoxX family protein n=1 Tax=Kitasatospora sp. GP82 TaxID=3035089 RepID=UPI002473FF52|nr:DoxX family protein [Kitasatospora sp. GP82]MDH6125893.1 putative oxidoreductase [Kitasatospora sp. GP82]
MKRIIERLRASPRPTATISVHPPPVSAADAGLLLLRSIGLLLAGHGAQKLFGLFGGHGLSATGKGFEALGYHPGTLFAGVAGASEMLGGLGLAAGLLTPLAAATVIGVMINAMVVTSARGLWETEGGMEYPLCIALVALALAAIGPGRFALDRPFRWGSGGWYEATVALGLGGIGAAIVLSL